MERRMGPLPNHRACPFQSVAVDVVGPIVYQGRWAGKGWGVVFICTTTLATHIELADTYSSTDSFARPPKIHVLQRDTITVPVGQEGAAGSSSQARLLVGLQGGDLMGRQKGDRVDSGAHGRAAFQWAGRKDDRADQKADLAKL
jgi:hypothetical protein